MLSTNIWCSVVLACNHFMINDLTVHAAPQGGCLWVVVGCAEPAVVHVFPFILERDMAKGELPKNVSYFVCNCTLT